ncbi:hypothetical protein GB937_008395 [Aspergillus fischeri]|nr:hypothetical protein GB937_008395 [Aspergillus fischeri]
MGEKEHILELDADVCCVAISRSGFQIAASTKESIVCFRGMGAAATQGALNLCHVLPVFALGFSSDGLKLASGHDDGCVVLWDLTGDGMVLNKALSPPHADSITQLAFCVDDTQLLSSSSDETIRVWDVTSGETEQILQKRALGPSILPRQYYAGRWTQVQDRIIPCRLWATTSQDQRSLPLQTLNLMAVTPPEGGAA